MTRFIVTLLLLLCMADAHAQTPDTLNDVLARYHALGTFDGVCAVGRSGKVVFVQGYGDANRATHAPLTPDTPFPICSITKQFTAVLVLQQAAAGKLPLTGTVDTYLPGFRTGDGITIQDLLTHTSGLANMDDFLPDAGVYAQKGAQFQSPAFLMKTYMTGPLLSKPGAKFSYNNADYVVLQAVLERVTGRSYAQLLAQNILKPCGMNRSGLITTDTFAPAQATDYVTDNGALVRQTQFRFANFSAAGGMFSTARDLLRYSFALDSGTLLPAAWQAKMFTPVAGLGYEGLSTWTYSANLPGGQHPLLQERDGEIGGFRTLLLRAPDTQTTLVLLGSTDKSEPGHVYEGRGVAFDLLRVLFPPVEKKP